MSPSTISRKKEIAEALSQLTDGEVRVEYDPSLAFSADGSSTGHLFTLHADPRAAVLPTLDDRECLRRQLALGLRDVARYYLRLPNRACRKICEDL
jgi:hypothetical protein